MRLFIAEKPELAKAIAKGLGNAQSKDGYIQCGDDYVTWCFGHMLELTDPEDHDPESKQWSLKKLPLQWPIEHKERKDAKKQLKVIKDLAKKADVLVNAGDPDDEGQLLVDEIFDHYGFNKPEKRVLIADYNEKIVKRAIDNIDDNAKYRSLSKSALARGVSDRVYGYNLTRAFTICARQKGVQGVLSVGRVQTPILGLVVNRDRANQNHKAAFYYDVHGSFNSNKLKLKLLTPEDAPTDEKKRIIDRDYAENVANSTKGQAAKITHLETKKKEESAPLPYNLLKLQSDASKRYGINSDQTLKITQSLREKHRLITYNRSDCSYLSDEQHADAPSVLNAIAATSPEFADAASVSDPTIKSRAFNSKNVTAHHAIIPTETHGDFTSLSDNEKKIYDLIARAYIAQFFPKAQFDETSVIVDVNGYEFGAVSKQQTLDGWKSLYRADKEDDDEEDQTPPLAWLTKETELECNDVTIQDKKTKPPAQYTESTLLNDLTQVAKYIKDPELKKVLIERDKDKKDESGGIGTPATRSSIIKSLVDRGFIEYSGKKIISTETGREFYDLLPEFAVTPDLTAKWQEVQNRIKNGDAEPDELIDSVHQTIAEQIENLKKNGLDIKARGVECPNCKTGLLVRRKGSNGFFHSCNQYPDCKTNFPDKAGKPDLNYKKPEASSEHKCPECGSGLIRRPGKKPKSFFWGCSGFPNCKYTAFDNKGKPKAKS